MVIAKFSAIMLEGKTDVYVLFVVASCGNRPEIRKLSIYLFLEMFSGIGKSHAVSRNCLPSLCSLSIAAIPNKFQIFHAKAWKYQSL